MSTIDFTIFFLFGFGLYLFIAGRIFLVAIISQGSWAAAMICLAIPFLEVGFIQKHFDEARFAAMLWGLGLVMMVAAYILGLCFA